jgi:methylenetetrahydrofolate dehydrogenase (NADP+)/methenyltetrahydrofolate cyclohydrolase
MAILIDGKAIAQQIQAEVLTDVERLRRERGVVPGLTVVLAGDDPASRTYVTNKARTSSKLGMNSVVEAFSADTSESRVISLIEKLNADPAVHGILVQLPLPPHLNASRILQLVDPHKDVDGLHPFNIGLLCAGTPRFIPCTPFGICELLARSGVSVAGREVVVVGRSNLVGRPLSVLLSSKGKFGDATVTVCHSRSAKLDEICRRAEILVVAIGKPRYVTGNMIRPGAVVIDVGTHPGAGPDGKMCGDVEFESVFPVASMLSPVPGGVGPMTIAMLMRNTVNAAIAQVS